MSDIDNLDDVIDIRDVIARVEHLEALRQPGPVDLGPDDAECSQDDLFAELAGLEKLLDKCRGNGGNEQWRGDWYPLILIHDSYFQEYAEQLAEDIGAVNKSAQWPNNCIDWKEAADQLKQDYTAIEFDGVTYWVR